MILPQRLSRFPAWLTLSGLLFTFSLAFFSLATEDRVAESTDPMPLFAPPLAFPWSPDHSIISRGAPIFSVTSSPLQSYFLPRASVLEAPFSKHGVSFFAYRASLGQVPFPSLCARGCEFLLLNFALFFFPKPRSFLPD